MITRIRQLFELIRFSHTVFALPFALLAAVMAWRFGYQNHSAQPFRWQDFVGIVACMVTARSTAMAFNRLADRNIDALNPRTAGRHLPAGILTVGAVKAFAALSSTLFVVSTLLFLPNRLPLLLAAPALLFLLGYSFAKRFTLLAHFWLGASLMLAPVCTWIAIRGDAVMAHPADLLPAVILGGAVLLWVAGFDILYSCQDVDFDRSQGLHSLPAKLGVPGALRAAAACHLGMVILLLLLPLAYPYFGSIYWAGLVAIAALLVYEHWLVRPDDLARVNTAFFQVNAVVSVGLFVFGALDLWRS